MQEIRRKHEEQTSVKNHTSNQPHYKSTSPPINQSTTPVMELKIGNKAVGEIRRAGSEEDK